MNKTLHIQLITFFLNFIAIVVSKMSKPVEQTNLILSENKDEQKESKTDNDTLTPNSAKKSIKNVDFEVDIKKVINIYSKEKIKRKIMIAMDGTEYSNKACDWAKNNLLKSDDLVLLISIWEDSMVNKLFNELDSEIIHPEIQQSHSKHGKLNHTFEHGLYLKNTNNVCVYIYFHIFLQYITQYNIHYYINILYNNS